MRDASDQAVESPKRYCAHSRRQTWLTSHKPYASTRYIQLEWISHSSPTWLPKKSIFCSRRTFKLLMPEEAT